MGKHVSIFVCGVQKGGTTSLHTYFTKHPELSPPSRKETHFFSNENIDWKSPNYEKLAAWYAQADGARLRFDITPIYCFWPPAMARIHTYNPDAKLIFLFRDPFDRAWSQWCMEFTRGNERLPFAEAIREGRARMQNLPELAPERRIFTYVERGYYADQVRRALKYFPKESILFLRSEDFLKHHDKVLEDIARFLNLGAFPEIGLIRNHKRAKTEFPSVPTDQDRRFVAEELREQMKDFSQLTGLDISGWPTAQLSAIEFKPVPIA